jgi:putative oxidoreductase
MFTKLISTKEDYATLVIRLALAAVMFPHGAQKLLGWFGGYGFQATVGYFTSQLGILTPLAVLVILAESLGAIALALGFVGRFMAFGIAAVMVGAIAIAHAQFGFFMNWSGQQGGEGFEYHILAIAMAVTVMIRGSGALSLDRLLQRRLSSTRADEAAGSPQPVVA